MFIVNDIYDEARKIIGLCDDTKLFRWLGDSVSLVANKADLEGWKGFLDVCSAGCASCNALQGNFNCNGNLNDSVCNSPAGCGRRMITLPREVDTVIGVNIGGQPTLGRSQLFEFHLNGPGSCRTTCEWAWTDQGAFHSTFRDITVPSKLVAYLDTTEDNGKQLIVYGYDDHGKLLRRFEGGEWKNGYRVPTVFGVAVPDLGAPNVARITGVFKDRTVSQMRLSTIDDSGATGTLLGVYEPDETTPQYRRILLNRSCNWARIAFLKTNPIFFSVRDHVPMRSRIALLMALQARKHYSDRAYELAHSCEADAARMELESQTKAESPTYMPIQVIDLSNPRDKFDYDIR